MTEQEKFEEWVIGHFNADASLLRKFNNAYYSHLTDRLWQAWQARAELDKEPK